MIDLLPEVIEIDDLVQRQTIADDIPTIGGNVCAPAVPRQSTGNWTGNWGRSPIITARLFLTWK
jgi:hypothetical protein